MIAFVLVLKRLSLHIYIYIYINTVMHIDACHSCCLFDEHIYAGKIYVCVLVLLPERVYVIVSGIVCFYFVT